MLNVLNDMIVSLVTASPISSSSSSSSSSLASISLSIDFPLVNYRRSSCSRFAKLVAIVVAVVVAGNGSGHSQLFSPRQQAKKKRKSRTAFTNHQIFELEKRFLYQKYLSPADRDEIALSLGLTNAQVITWFQNRRAKLKRDMEELKKDVESAKMLGTPVNHPHHPHHLQQQRNAAEMSLLQKKAEEYNQAILANE